MNTIDFEAKRNLALSTDMHKFLQDAKAELEKLAALGGTDYILSGCVDDTSSTTAGFIVLNGMVMPFLGGVNQATIKIVETNTNIVVGALDRDQKVFHAEFGTTAVPGYQFDWDIVGANRFDDLVDITDRLAIAEAELDIITNIKGALTITSPAGAITEEYAKYSISTYIAVLEFKFDINGGGATDPEFTFNIALTGANIGTQIICHDDQNGFGFMKITGLTPLKLQFQGGIASGVRTFKVSTSIAL